MNTPVTQAQAREAIQRARPFGGYGLTEPFEVLLAFIAQHPDAQAGDWIANVVRDVAELPDRNSPEDWPEAMLVTADELRAIILAAAPARSEAPDPPRGSAPLAHDERSDAEQAYTLTAFDYASAPIGSRDWSLYWRGWWHRAEHYATPPPSAPRSRNWRGGSGGGLRRRRRMGARSFCAETPDARMPATGVDSTHLGSTMPKPSARLRAGNLYPPHPRSPTVSVDLDALGVMYGTAYEADFGTDTLTFKMQGDYKIAGIGYVILPTANYELLIAELRALRALQARVEGAPVYDVPAKKPDTPEGWLPVIAWAKAIKGARGQRVRLVTDEPPKVSG